MAPITLQELEKENEIFRSRDGCDRCAISSAEKLIVDRAVDETHTALYKDTGILGYSEEEIRVISSDIIGNLVNKELNLSQKDISYQIVVRHIADEVYEEIHRKTYGPILLKERTKYHFKK